MGEWVQRQANGSAGPGQGVQGRARDQSSDFADGGVYGPPPWLGTAAAQLALIALFVLTFVVALLGVAVRGVTRRIKPRRASPGGQAGWLIAGSSALNLVVLGGVLALIGLLLVSERDVQIPGLFALLPGLSLLATLGVVGLCGLALARWMGRRGSLAGRLACSAVALVGLLFVAYLAYWNLLGMWL